MRSILFVMILSAIAAADVSAQHVIQTGSVSGRFEGLSGNPRIVQNQHHWLIVWRNQGSAASLRTRIVHFDGTEGSVKTLALNPKTSDSNFDMAYDPDSNRYALVYKGSNGLYIQLFDETLARIGNSTLLENDRGSIIPRIIYDENEKRFVVFWIGSPDGLRPAQLKSTVLDNAGKPAAVRLLKETTGKYESLAVHVNHRQQKAMAVITEIKQNSTILTGLDLNPDGTRTDLPPQTYQAVQRTVDSAADLSFSIISGTGMVFWNHDVLGKSRRINRNGAPGSPIRQISRSDNNDEIDPSILYNANLYAFIASWTTSAQIRMMLLNVETARPLSEVFTIGESSLDKSGHIDSDYDFSIGNTLFVWEDFTTTGASIRQIKFAIIDSNPIKAAL